MGSKLVEIQPRETQVYNNRDLDRGSFNDGISPASHRMFLEIERVMKELGGKVTEDSLVLLPKLLTYLKHDDPFVVKQSISTGTSLFCAVLVEIAVQLNKSDGIEWWLEKMWSLMLQFKDAVFGIMLEPGSVGAKLIAVKFLETCVLTLTSDEHVGAIPFEDGKESDFNVSWITRDHPVFKPTALALEANTSLKLLLDLLSSIDSLRGSLAIAVVNSLATIARKRPLHYDGILTALFDFAANDRTLQCGHIASIKYSLRTVFSGLFKCSNPSAIESREKLLRCIRSLTPDETSEQVSRLADKTSRTDRMSRNIQLKKDDELPGHMLASRDSARMRPGILFDDSSISEEAPQKKMRYSSTFSSTQPDDKASDSMDIPDSSNDFSLKDDLSPVEKMIAMIGALLAEGKRGSESLEILISNIHADLLADIVLETMKHLPKNSVTSSVINGNMRASSHLSPRGSLLHVGSFSGTMHSQSPFSSQFEPPKSDSSEITMPSTDLPALSNVLPDSKRDPRRDPRRFDPRLATAPTLQTSPLNLENDGDSKNELYQSTTSNLTSPLEDTVEHPPTPSLKGEGEVLDTIDSNGSQLASNENLEVEDDVRDTAMEVEPPTEVQVPASSPLSTVHAIDQEPTVSDPTASQSIDANLSEPDVYSSAVPATLTYEDVSHDLSILPAHVELTFEQKQALCKLAIARIFKDCKKVSAVADDQSWLPLLARLVAQSDADGDMISLVQNHIILDCNRQKGQELTMLVLYHIHAITTSESNENSNLAASNYEKFLLSIAKGLLDSFPASDKSFCRLLGEAPFLPDSALRLLEDVCYSSVYDPLSKGVLDGDRATQALGTLWSLILGRPSNRLACLEIALQCAVHAKEEVRTKAIRLVVNKLFPLQYASENIENFARKMLLSVADHQVSQAESQHISSSGQRADVCNQESSIRASQNSEIGQPSESETTKVASVSSQNVVLISSAQAQQKTSLFFALCSKKPSLFKLVFDIYGRAPKVVKQAIHRNVPIFLRNLGASSNELQDIISNPPEGCENLITLVLQVLTEESTAGPDLIASVKHLYETRMKDAAILIPILSSLSKDEVLPIFPRLVDLPIEKFQAALACILQGSAHTGPALTPVEVLTAIHDINPDKDGVALKKITDACTACFEQRTVFTQQVLEKSLNSLVDRAPLPLLLMRTVIQTIDAFPMMVDFMMGILSRLVSRQIWKMPKLWVGFLKCVSQTIPHSFNALLELPPPQIESALNKYPEMRIPLTSYANQASIRSLLSRQALEILGLGHEQQ